MTREIDFPWEKEKYWLDFEESLRANHGGDVPFDTLRERYREVFDACWFDHTGSMEEFVASVSQHVRTMMGHAMMREEYIIQLEEGLRAEGLQVPPAPPWALTRPSFISEPEVRPLVNPPDDDAQRPLVSRDEWTIHHEHNRPTRGSNMRVVPSQIVELIDQFKISFHHTIGHEHTTHLAAVLTLVEEKLPPDLLVLPPEDYSLFVTALEDVRNVLRKWQNLAASQFGLSTRTEFGNMNGLGFIHKCLSTCPDESTAAASSELSFIQDDVTRNGLQHDLSAVNTALANGEWKGATVLAGSLCEALLLWKLQQRPASEVAAAAALVPSVFTKKSPPDLEHWHLHEYLEVSAHLKLITDATASQTRLARNFRNFIHPGVSTRMGQKCDRGTALAAVAAVELITRDFTPS